MKLADKLKNIKFENDVSVFDQAVPGVPTTARRLCPQGACGLVPKAQTLSCLVALAGLSSHRLVVVLTET